jgi:type II secretory pathway component GspD/PulD (secretin)
MAFCLFLGAAIGAAAENGNSPSVVSSNSPPQTNAVAPATNQAAPLPPAHANGVSSNGVSSNGASAGSAPAEFKPTDHNIRFQFDGLPYSEVVTRFAQMVNKPLIADTNVEGTLTFNDPQAYSYAEALETLNLILSLKGVMLMESGRYLRLVPFKDLQQMPIPIFRGLDHAGAVQPDQVVTVVLSLRNLEASEIAQSITPMLSNAGTIAPLSRARGLIVTDHLANIQRVRDLLAEVDTASPTQREMRSFTLRNSSGAVLMDMINRTFGLATAPRRVEFNQQTKSYHQLPADASDYVTAVFDDASRTLVLFGPADRLGLAESLIKQFEDKSGVQAGEVKIFYPQANSAQELARMLRQAMPSVAAEGDTGAAAATKARLIVDAGSNRLIVTAPAAGQLDEIEKLVKQIDGGVVHGSNTNRSQDVQLPYGRQLKAITLKYTSANSIATMLMQLYGRQFRAEDPRLRVLATASNDDKTLLLEAIPAMIVRIEEAIRILDVEPTRGPFEVRTYQLAEANAADLAQTLARLFANGPGRTGDRQPQFESDPASNSLIVAATKEQFEQIDQLIKELRASVEVATEIRTFTLKYSDPGQMVAILTTMLHEQNPVNQYRRFRSSPYGGPIAEVGTLRIATAPALNAVVLQGPPDKLRLAELLINTLDKERTDPASTIRTVRLKKAQAQATAEAVGRILDSRGIPGLTRRTIIIPVSSSNTLLVDGPEAQVDEVLQVIQQLDEESSGGSLEFHIYHLVKGNAAEISRVLGQMLESLARNQARNGRANPEPPVTMAVDDRSNSLIISATADSFKVIDDLLKQLDSNQPAERAMRIVPVKSMSASELATKIRPLYLDQARSLPAASGPEAMILPDDYNDRLILTASAPQLKLIEDLAKQLDVAPDQSNRQLKTITLNNSSASWIATMLQQLYSRQFRAENPRLRVVVTPASNDRNLVLEAPTNMIARIEEAIQTLDAEPARSAFEIRTYQLTGAVASDMVLSLTRLFAERQDWQKHGPGLVTQPRFEADPTSNTLIVAATKEQFIQIDELIKELRASVEVATEIRTFTLKYCEPDRMVQLLDTMLHEETPPNPSRVRGAFVGNYGAVTDYGKLRIATAPAINAVVIHGPPDKLRLAEMLITSLDKERTDPASTIRSVRLKKAQAQATAEAVGRILDSRLAPGLTRRTIIIPVSSSNTLLVNGPPAEAEEVLQVIQQLDEESSGGSLEFHIYHLEKGNAAEISRVLGQMLESLARNQARNGRVNPEPPVTMAVDDRSNSLIISATADSFKVIDNLLKQLDSNQPAERTMRIIPVKAMPASELATKIRPLYLDQAKSLPAASGPEAMILPDDYNDRLIVTASAPQLKLIEDLAKELDVAPDQSDRQLKTITLNNSSASWIATMLQQLYSRQFRAENPRLRVVVTPASNDRNLVLEAPTNMIARIEEAIQTLDAEPARSAFEIRTYQLTGAVAGDMVLSLTRLFAERQDWQKHGPGLVTQPRFEADPTSNTLIVAATKEQFIQIDELIKELRASVEVATEIRIFKLKYCDPDQMVQLLDTMLHEQTPAITNRVRAASVANYGAVTDYGKLRIATAPALNAVVLQGPPDKLRLAEQLITTLDKEKADLVCTIRTVHLSKARPEAVAEAVSKTLEGRGTRNQTRRTTVTPVAASNSIIIDGPPSEVEEVLQIIQELDRESSNGNIEFHIYRLENGNPQETSRILGQMLQALALSESRFGKAAQRVPVTVAVDARSNSLIISATPESFKVIDKLLAALDKAPKRPDRSMNLYTLENVDPFELASKLEALYADRPKDEQVSAEADPYSNSLTVIAPQEDFPAIEEMIRRMDEAAIDRSLQVRMVPLARMPAAQMAAMLTNVYSQIASGEVRLVDRLPPRSRERSQLRATPISMSRSNSPASLTNQTKAAAAALPSTNQHSAALFFPEVVIAVDKASNALLLSGPAHELDEIQTIIRDLTRAASSNDTELRLYSLREADPVVVARTLNELFRPDQGQGGLGGGANAGGGRSGRRSAEAPLPGQPPVQVPPARIVVVSEPRTRSIIIRAHPNDFSLVEPLIKQLDAAGLNAQLGFRLVPLENVHPEQLLPLVTQMMAELRIARPGDPVTVVADPRGRALFVVARNSVLDQVEAMIHELDTAANYAEAEVLLLPLKHANAPQLAAILQGMLRPGTQGEVTVPARELQEQVRRLKIQNAHGEPVVLDLAKPIKIMPDPIQGAQGGANRLVLVSTADNLKALSSVIAMMDTVPSTANIRIFPLQYADAATLQTLITELYQGPGFSRMRPEERPSVVVDDRTDSLIVSGNETAFSMVTNLLEHLDKEGLSLAGQIRLLPLKHATAQSLAMALTTLFNQRAQSSRSPDAQRKRPVIIPDPRSNSLLVSAGVEDSQALDALLEKLDRKPENAAVSITVIGLRHNDSAQVASMLTTVFAARRRSITAPGQPPAPQDEVDVAADPLVNALIISASPENLELARNLITQVDAEPVVQEGLIQTFTLKQADAQRAATMLRSLVDQGIYRPGIAAAGNRRTSRDAIAVTVDARSNTLIISASPENLVVVKELIKQIDSQNYSADADIRLFQLKHAKASQLATVLQQFFTSKRSGEASAGTTERSIPVTVTADDRTSTLLVTGGREVFAAVERMVAQLDAEQVVARTSFKVFSLKQATAAKLQSTLTQLFAKRPATIRGEPPDSITIVEDSWANALIVGASPEDLVMVESLISQLDNGLTEAGMEVQVMPLAKADARQVAQTITTLYRSGGPGTVSPVTANVDERLNAVVVSAGQSDIKRIADLVKKLDTDQVTQVNEIHVFTLTNARATQLSVILTSILNSKPTSLTGQSPSRQSLLQFMGQTPEGKELLTSALKEGVLIAPDVRANAIVISAPVEYMRLLQQLIGRLDATSPQVAIIRVFALRNADARQMMTVLTSLFHLQPSSQSTGQSTTQPVSNNRTVKYNLTREVPDFDPFASGADEVGASAVLGTAEETALTVSVDIRSNSLIVGGSDHYVALASEIIETLDSSPAQERKFEVYHLKNSRASQIQGSLQTFLTQDTQLLITAVGQQAMTQELLDRQATIVADTNSNTLLISATPRNFPQISKLVEELDQPQRQVLIQVLIAEVTLTKDDELGVEWTYQTGGNPSTKTGTDFGVANALKSAGGFGSAISGDKFNFLFRAFQSEDRLHVLSRPQILTSDNQQATIMVGQEVPLVTGSQVIGLTGNSVNTFNYTNVGVTLSVTPNISPDGFVRMVVAPQITELTTDTVEVSTGINAPILNQRTATTSVSVQSGQSILIGGLISTTDELTSKKVPVLGSLPLLGPLFRSNIKTSTRTELLILLTPQVLINGEAMATTNSALSVTREQLDTSAIKHDYQSGPLYRQMLGPLYPESSTNAPAALPSDEKSKATPHEDK